MQSSKISTADHNPGPSRSHSKRKLPTNPQGEETTATPESHHRYTQSSIIDSLSQSKRQKSTHSPPYPIVDDNMSKVIGLVGRPNLVDSMRRGSTFQPHSGPKKLVVKNLRKEPRADLQNYYDNILAQVKEALRAIFNGQRPLQPLERLYRDVEDLCRNGQAESLYKHLKLDSETYLRETPLRTIEDGLAGKSSTESLREIHRCWNTWTSQVVCISFGHTVFHV